MSPATDALICAACLQPSPCSEECMRVSEWPHKPWRYDATKCTRCCGESWPCDAERMRLKAETLEAEARRALAILQAGANQERNFKFADHKGMDSCDYLETYIYAARDSADIAVACLSAALGEEAGRGD